MKRRTIYVIAVLFLGCVVMLPVIHASEFDEATLFKFSEPVQVPGHVLPAGNYWFTFDTQLGENQPTNVVLVYNYNRSRLVATFETRPAELPWGALNDTMLNDNTLVTLAEHETNHGTTSPAAVILNWFYPGQKDGHEFIYPNREQAELGNAREQVLTINAHVSRVQPNLTQAAITK